MLQQITIVYSGQVHTVDSAQQNASMGLHFGLVHCPVDQIVSLPTDRLDCVLRATDAAHCDAVTDWLRVSARIGRISTCRTDTELRARLQDSSPGRLPALVVLVVSHSELPPYLLRYPDLKVLVLTTNRKVGSLTPWLQQGASDVATITRPMQAQHALGRLIDECALKHQVYALSAQLQRSDQRVHQVIRRCRGALSLWRDQSLMCCSDAFTELTGLSAGASEADWFSAFSEHSRAQLGLQMRDLAETTRATAADQERTLRITHDRLIDADGNEEHLVTVKVVVEARVPTLPALETDSVSGLPARQTVVNKFQHWLQSNDKQARYVAMVIDLSAKTVPKSAISAAILSPRLRALRPSKRKASANKELALAAAKHMSVEPTAVDRTLQDLAVFRAADRLSSTLSANTLMGRLSGDRLLIVQALKANEAPRMLAKGIRRSLGSLGGLLNSAEGVRINTVNVCGNRCTSAENLVNRLEKR